MLPSGVNKQQVDARRQSVKIGPWIQCHDKDNVQFIRTDDQSNRWSDMGDITVKNGQKRVLYLGESVARGFFFDPEFTPAKVLNSMLDRAGSERYEVIDLAANDLGPMELRSILEKAYMLEPDAMVIFAGNNWRGSGLDYLCNDDDRRTKQADIVLEKGLSGVRGYVEQELFELAKVFCDGIQRLASKLAIPTVMIIPESNLVDWQDYSGYTAPWLSGENNSEWLDLKDQAMEAYSSTEYEQCIEAADKLIELDERSCFISFRLKALCFKAQGDIARSRYYFNQARDALLWDARAFVAPRCHEVMKRALRNLTSEHVKIIDLPTIFAGNDSNQLPDRRLFLDYCHLSKDGIQIAMSETARTLLSNLEKEMSDVRVRSSYLQRSRYAPTNKQEGLAHFLAAIHNAHWDQDPEVIQYHLKRSVDVYPPITEIMRMFVLSQGRKCAPFLAKEFNDKVLQDKVLSYYLLRYNLERSFDVKLIDMVVDFLPDSVQTKELVETIRASEWGVTRSVEVDLLAAEFRECQPDRCRITGLDNWNYWYRAYSRVSRFFVPSAKRQALSLGINIRHGQYNKAVCSLRIEINTGHLCEIDLESTWKSYTVNVPEHMVHPGLNELVLECSHTGWDCERAIADCADDLRMGRDPYYQPFYFDMDYFTVTVNRKCMK